MPESFIDEEFVNPDAKPTRAGSAVEMWVAEAARSAFHQGIQSPFNGAAQLWNHTAGRVSGTHIGKMDLADAPDDVEFNSGRWYAQTLGGAAGMVLPFMLCKATVSGFGGGLRSASRLALGEAATSQYLNTSVARIGLPALEAGATGALFEGVFRPVKEERFLEGRLSNATSGMLTFSALHAGTVGLKALDRSVLSTNSPWLVNTYKHDVARHMVAGLGAGALDANIHSLLEGKGLASREDTLKSAYTFGMLGGLTRSVGELAARSKGDYMAGDLVAKDPSLHQIMRGSEQARMLLSDFGDLRINRSSLIGWQHNPVSKAGLIVSNLALAEAKANVAPGEQWSNITERKLNELQQKASESNSSGDRAMFKAHAEELQKTIDAAKRTGLPDTNWEQARYAMFREFAFLNSLKRNLGPSAEYNAPIDTALKTWRTRWSQSVDAGQELMAQLSSPFNANHANAKSAEEYNRTMRESGPTKAAVVTRAIDGIVGSDGRSLQNPIVVDIGSADGFIPDAIGRTRPDATVFAVDLDPHSFLGMLAKKRAADARPDAKDAFRAIPLFADGVNPKLPLRSVDAFSSLSNVHELISYPRDHFGQYSTGNARLALGSWARSLNEGGRIVIKDFLKPEGNQRFYLEFKDRGAATGQRPLVIENEPYADEYASGRGGATFFQEFTGQKPWRSSELGQPLELEKVRYKGNNLNYEEVRNERGELVGIYCDARTAQELMISSQYGMRELRPEMKVNVDEQYVNFSLPQYDALVGEARSAGSRIVPTGFETRTGSDYLAHRNMFYNLSAYNELTGTWNRVDLSANNKTFDVTFQGSYQKTRGGIGTRLLSATLGPLERAGRFSPQMRIGSLSTSLIGNGSTDWQPSGPVYLRLPTISFR
jgi:SAM-dependent methyltransferase